MKKKYLYVSEVSSVNSNRNNAEYFAREFSNFLEYLVKKNRVVCANKFQINFLILAFMLFSIMLSFLF
jgi:hypothetical protein